MVYRKLRSFKFIEMRTYRYALEIVALLAEFLETFAVKAADFYQLANFGNRFFQVIDFSWRYFQGVSEKVVCEDHAVFIHDQTAIRNNRHQRDAVVFSECLVVIVLLDLQVGESERQCGKQAEYD